MGHYNLNTQDKIKRPLSVNDTLILDIRLDYFTICPNPVEFDIKIISGNKNLHRYKWEIISGPFGKFHPNASALFTTFNPLGNKEKRVVLLTVDKGEENEQQFLINLYDKAVSYSNSVLENTSNYIHSYNDLSLATSEIDMSIDIDFPLFPEKEKLIEISSSGKIQYKHPDTFKIEVFEYPSMIKISEVLYPESIITGIDTSKEYIIRTWFEYPNLDKFYVWDFLKVKNKTTDIIKILFLREDVPLHKENSESYFITLYGSGLSKINIIEVPLLYLFNSIAYRRIKGSKWRPIIDETYNETPEEYKQKEMANNSIRMQKQASGSGIITLLKYKVSNVG